MPFFTNTSSQANEILLRNKRLFFQARLLAKWDSANSKGGPSQGTKDMSNTNDYNDDYDYSNDYDYEYKK